MELLKDYDVTILYHPGKANVVVDALSRKAGSMGSLDHLQVSRRPVAREIQNMANDFMRLEVNEKGGRWLVWRQDLLSLTSLRENRLMMRN